MKELSIEQKAKAYDKALERAKEKYTTCYSPALLDYIFPELKEDDGEKSKKWILEYLYDGLRKSDEQFKDHFKTAIAWLKKQNPNANKEYWRGYREGKQEILDKYAELEKQGEQEFIDSDTLIQQRVDTLADIDAKQSSADNVKPKVKNEIEIPFGAKDSELQEATYYIPKGFHAEIDGDFVVIKKGKKPTAWSKEDERICYSLLADIKTRQDSSTSTLKAYYDEQIDWLKSLKQRIGG